MKNWTIGQRIIAGGAILIGFYFLTNILALNSVLTMEKFADVRLRNDVIPGIVEMSTIQGSAMRSHTRAILANNARDAAQREVHLGKMVENDERVVAAMKRYEAALSVDEDRANFQSLAQRASAYHRQMTGYLQLVKEGKRAEAEDYYSASIEKVWDDYRLHANQMLTWNQAQAGSTAEQMVAVSTRALRVGVIIAVIGGLISLALGWMIIRSTNRALRGIASALRDASAQVSSAAGQVSSASQSLAQGASEQAASLEETSASLEEISSMTQRNAEGADNARNLSHQTSAATETSTQRMSQMLAAMNAIKSSSDNISKIIKTIDEIAFQTNILALNAAVEAARAGEAGAGFAVVADEVRALAQRAAQAAKETAEKIDDSIAKSGNGVDISAQVSEGLAAITAKVSEVNNLVAEIATASKEQTQGLSQVNTAVSQMDKVTQANASSAEETAAAAEELNAQAATLLDTVNQLNRLVGATGQSAARAVPPPAAAQPRERRTIELPAEAPQTLRPGGPVSPKLRSRQHSEPAFSHGNALNGSSRRNGTNGHAVNGANGHDHEDFFRNT